MKDATAKSTSAPTGPATLPQLLKSECKGNDVIEMGLHEIELEFKQKAKANSKSGKENVKST